MIDFHRLIADWYRLNFRLLPWRSTNNPYLIWLSEIILQQTRVAQGLEYYKHFQEKYPTIQHLANANEQEILTSWQGLGYYSRARNLHSTAKIITQKHKGIFPSSYDKIRKLKGIGDYTAAAIASFAFKLPYAVVDGNVYRVLSRVYNCTIPIDTTIGKKHYAQLASDLLGKNPSDIHNQAMMELGAMICTPNTPSCANCPVSQICHSAFHPNASLLPIKEKKTKVRERFFNFLIIQNENGFYLEKRIEKDIWQH